MILFEAHVYGLILNKKNEVLILKAKNKEKYMFPGGTVEKKEKIKKALLREIKEETSLKVKILNLIDCELIINKKPKHIALFYLCKTNKTKIILSKEHAAFIWIKPSKISKNMLAHNDLLNLFNNKNFKKNKC